jgi:hypothetical protein
MEKTSVVPYYDIPGTDLQLIDVIWAKMTRDEWRRFLWASCLQYAYRVLDKGEPVKDADKCIVYMTWLRDSFKEGK